MSRGGLCFTGVSRSGRVGVGNSMRVLVAVAAVLLLCLPAFSQLNLGRITGTVTDQSGGVIVGATVTVLDVDRGILSCGL